MCFYKRVIARYVLTLNMTFLSHTLSAEYCVCELAWFGVRRQPARLSCCLHSYGAILDSDSKSQKLGVIESKIKFNFIVEEGMED